MKIRKKILLVFIIVFCIISAALLFIIRTEKNKTKLLIDTHYNSQKRKLGNILKFKSEILHKVTFNYTYWDEMVQFVSTGDTNWANENINKSAVSFQLNAFWVYNPGKKLIYQYNNELNSDSIGDIIPSEVFNELPTSKYIRYFTKTKSGLYEISGATIHPSKDIDRKTPPQGYLFIAKVWDDSYIKDLESLSGYHISFSSMKEETPPSNHALIVTVDTLYGFDKKPLVKLVCKRPLGNDSIYRNLTFKSFIFVSILTLLLIVIFGISFNFFIYRPLTAITKFLDKRDTRTIDNLKDKKNEFGRISKMLIEFFDQKTKQEIEINERRAIQNSLLESQKRLQAIISNSPNVAIEGYDINGKVLFWNEAAEKIFGYKEKEVLGKTLDQSILDKKAAEYFLDTLKEIDRTNKPTEPSEWQTKTKDNRVVTVLSTIFPIYSDISDEKIFVCMDIDMSERNTLQKQLQLKNEEIIAQNEELTVAYQELTESYSEVRRNEEIFRSVIEQANDGILLFDSECRIIVRNKAAETITGFANEEVIGKYIWDIEFQLLPSDMRTAETKAILESNYREISKTRSVPIKLQHIEREIIAIKDKKHKSIKLSTFIIPTEKSFLIGRVVHDLTNISETKKTLEKSEKRFRDLAELLPIVVFEMDLAGKTTYLNKKALDLFGYEEEYLKNEVHFVDTIPKNFINNASTILEKIINGTHDSNIAIELPILTRTGTEIPCLIYTAVIKDTDNQPMGIRGALLDLSEQKKAEELQRQLEVSKKTAEIKQQFLANMSHEIRTPMMGIIGMIDLLNKTKLSTQQLDFIETIKDSSETLLTIINDILDLSKIESGKTEIKAAPFNIHSITQKIRTLFAALAKHKKITYLTSYTDDLPDYISADENKITQIITNLVSNAVKFTQQGSVTVKFSLASKTDTKLHAKVEVIDTGIGINKEDQEIIFTTFTQLDSANTRNFDGTGLGLSICQKLTQLMGGEIGVISELGKGSTFWFTFDAETIDSDQIVKTIINRDKSNLQQLNLFILLVEDKFVNQKVIELMLNDVGCKIDIASNGQKALDMYETDKYDLILMDIQMPVMDGITTLRLLKKKFKKLVPVIALSANVMEGDEESYLSEGMNDYIGKPVNQIDLIEKIAKWTINYKK